MIRGATACPTRKLQNVLVVAAMCAAATIQGCGGGGGGTGGGGGGSNPCGSASLGNTVICGFVAVSGSSSTGVNSATVRLRSATGTTLYTAVTTRDPVTGKDGFYKITAGAALPALISVDVPVGYLPGYIGYAGRTYDTNRTSTDGLSPCVPAVSITSGIDNYVANNLFVFSELSVPPAPVFICPR